ncbi:MAG: TolB family protein, partial [Candidatus Krumholzibacteriia bacterium]
GVGNDLGRVAVVDLGGTKRDLTGVWSSASGLSWSPAGDEIWFTASETGTIRALYAVDLTGKQRLVTRAPADMTLHDVSREGRVLVTRNNARRRMIGLAPGETSERNLSWFDWGWPSDLSADGTTLLFEEEGEGGGSAYAVYVRKTDGPRCAWARECPRRSRPTASGCSAFHWVGPASS